MEMTDKQNKELTETIAEILLRGNDVEVRQSKDGVKVLEVKRSVKVLITPKP